MFDQYMRCRRGKVVVSWLPIFWGLMLSWNLELSRRAHHHLCWWSCMAAGPSHRLYRELITDERSHLATPIKGGRGGEQDLEQNTSLWPTSPAELSLTMASTVKVCHEAQNGYVLATLEPCHGVQMVSMAMFPRQQSLLEQPSECNIQARPCASVDDWYKMGSVSVVPARVTFYLHFHPEDRVTPVTLISRPDRHQERGVGY